VKVDIESVVTVSTAVSKNVEIIKPKHTVNHLYLTCFSLLLAMASAIQVGYILSCNGQVGFVLAQKLGWEQSSFFNNVVLSATLSPMGIAIGSLIGGIVADKISLRNLILVANAFGILFNFVNIQETTPTILLGRFFAGVAGGLMNFSFGKALNETVPQEHSSAYGMLVNAGICAGIFFAGVMGLIIPLEDINDPTSYEKMKNDQNWKIVWGVPILMGALSLILIPIFIKSLSLKNVIQTS